MSFISCLYVFRAHVFIIRRSKLYYTASGIITPIGGGLVHRLREDQAKFPTPSLCLIWLEIKKKVGRRYEEERGRRDMTQLREGFRNRFLKGF
jgi:hypothetical protein